MMTQTQIAANYQDAIVALQTVRVSCVGLDVAWRKVDRIQQYLQRQAEIALKPTFEPEVR
jgi:hypothetical protein